MNPSVADQAGQRSTLGGSNVPKFEAHAMNTFVWPSFEKQYRYLKRMFRVST